MNTGESSRGSFDRLLGRIGCVLAMLPIGGACLLALAEVFKIPAAWLVITTLVLALVSDTATSRVIIPPPTRRISHYERIKRVVEAYEEGKISATQRDQQLKEIERE